MMLAPWKESSEKPRQHIKKQWHHFTDKCLYSQSYGFCSSHVQMWELDYEEGWVSKDWCFQIVVDTLLCVRAKSFQSCPTLCDPVDCGLPGSSVHGILQARTMDWVAISSTRGSSQSRYWTCISNVSCIGRQVLYH